MLMDEFMTPLAVPMPILCLRLVGAVVLCGLIGFEREWSSHAAGLRTNMLIGLGAAVMALIVQNMLVLFDTGEGSVRLDPMRLIDATTAGVAFLAAGMIVFSQGKVKNLTTGAAMWLSAAIGLAVGLGIWTVAVPATILAVLVTGLASRLKRKSDDEDA